MSSPSEKALQVLKYLPRVNLDNLTRNPYRLIQPRKGSSKNTRKQRDGHGQKGFLQRQKYLPLGYEHGRTTPFYLRVPVEDYYRDIQHRRQYPPLTLYRLQLLIDTGKIDINQPIDLQTLCKTNQYHIDTKDNHYGVHLTDEGIDVFTSKVNIEVQHASEQVIAAVERNGGVIRNAFYDIFSVSALANPIKFFERGEPIPKRLLPSPDCIGFYTGAASRGYLADPDKIAAERFKLAQKYGYVLPDITKDPQFKMLTLQKDPRQVFYGLNPGWLINLRDKQVLKPSDELIKKFYEAN